MNSIWFAVAVLIVLAVVIVGGGIIVAKAIRVFSNSYPLTNETITALGLCIFILGSMVLMGTLIEISSKRHPWNFEKKGSPCVSKTI